MQLVQLVLMVFLPGRTISRLKRLRQPASRAPPQLPRARSPPAHPGSVASRQRSRQRSRLRPLTRSRQRSRLRPLTRSRLSPTVALWLVVLAMGRQPRLTPGGSHLAAAAAAAAAMHRKAAMSCLSRCRAAMKPQTRRTRRWSTTSRHPRTRPRSRSGGSGGSSP